MGDGAKANEKGPGKFKKNEKKGVMAQVEGSSFGELSRWSKSLKHHSKRRARAVRAMVGKRQKGEVTSGCSATIVALIISCEIERNGKRSRRSFAPPREIKCPAPFAHMDRSPGWNPWTTRQQRGRW